MTTAAVLPSNRSSGILTFVRSHRLAAYFALAFAGTWLLFLPLIAVRDLSRDAATLFFVLSIYLGPTLAAVSVTAISDGRDLLRRIVRWRVGIAWYAVALFVMLILWLVGFSLLFEGAPLRAFVEQPLMIVTVFLPSLMLNHFINGMGEEIGWRGFALPRLQRRYGPLVGTLALGLLHSVWHLPAFFTPVLGPFTLPGFGAFVLTGIAGTFIYTWIFNHTRQSILIAALVHAASNAASGMVGMLLPADLTPDDPRVGFLMSGAFNVTLFGIAALILILATRGRLGYRADEAA